jgi:hypothetical protein
MYIKTRLDLGKLFMTKFKTGNGAEIGVQNGFNSKQIFEYWKGNITLVDRWDNPEELKTCITNLQGKDYSIIIGDSAKSADLVPDNSLDWIYIDAGHSYEEVKADYEAWVPKVRKGGIISGHDYGENDCIGVKHWIDELVAAGGKFEFTTEDYWEGKEYQSWWTIKL